MNRGQFRARSSRDYTHRRAECRERGRARVGLSDGRDDGLKPSPSGSMGAIWGFATQTSTDVINSSSPELIDKKYSLNQKKRHYGLTRPLFTEGPPRRELVGAEARQMGSVFIPEMPPARGLFGRLSDLEMRCSKKMRDFQKGRARGQRDAEIARVLRWPLKDGPGPAATCISCVKRYFVKLNRYRTALQQLLHWPYL